MKSRIKNMALCLLALFFVVSSAQAQSQYDRASYSQAELEQMLAPVALYPDSLLSQVLMAATYPSEVVEAAYWLRANPGLRGENAIQAAESMQWDISVKSLLPFPHLLNTMESRYDWTKNLGNAFLGQQAQVMDTIQVLRHRAAMAGYLRSDSHISVVQDGQLISIAPVQPTIVYVPYYNPRVVYGHWPQPAYAPVMWDPWPGYPVRHYQAGWSWSPVATIVTVGVLYAVFDWRHRHVYHRPHVTYWHRHPHYVHHKHYGPQHHWRHDPRHRREVPYRHPHAERHYGKAARTHNQKVGPRPTAHDIRSGRHSFQATSKPHDRKEVHHRPDNRRYENSIRHSSQPNRATHAPEHRVHSAPRGVAHGVRGTQPSASVRSHGAPASSPYHQRGERKPSVQNQHAAPVRGGNNGHRAASPRGQDRPHGASANHKEKPRHEASSKRDDKSHRDRD